VAKEDSFRHVDRDLIAEGFLSDEPYRMVEEMSAIGSRFAGTESERVAVEYLQKKMAEYGLENVRAEEYKYTGWIRGPASLQVTHPTAQSFEVLGLPGTIPGTVEAELLYIGLGTMAQWDAQKDKVKGKIILVDAKSPAWIRRGIHRREKYGRAISLGAVGLIWMRDQGGFLIETGGLLTPTEIPCVGISREHGMALVHMASKSPDKKVRVQITVEATIKEMPSWNVVGEIPGTTAKDRIICVGAHFDGHDIATGSMDDASGTAVTIEAARLLARHKGAFARTMQFVAFSAEESGLLGSRRFVRTHEAELDKYDFMLNLDGAGRGGERGVMLQAWPELLPVFSEISRNMKWPFVTDVVLGMHSDMYPFSYLGVPSGTLASVGEVRTGRDYGHTAADTLDKVSAHGLRMDSTFVARLVGRLAGWAGWPAKRKTTEEIVQIIKETGLYDVMKYSTKDVI